jgi:predicted N-acetyltransferase YhbS
MFKVKLMRERDYFFATKLANTMDWNMAKADFEFMKFLESRGCFVLYEGYKKIGIATCISYGELGWFGNLIVKKEYRNMGGGKVLVNHAKDYLRAKGVRTIGLYAYPNLTNFYGCLGFELDEDFSVLCAQSLDSFKSEPLPIIGELHSKSVSKMDRQCFGGDRKKLLESIILGTNNVNFYFSEDNKVLGYVASTVNQSMAWIGPLICDPSRPDIAILLVKAVLSKLHGKTVYTVVPKKNSLLFNSFINLGFRESFFVSRMYFGERPAGNCIYLPESLERG